MFRSRPHLQFLVQKINRNKFANIKHEFSFIGFNVSVFLNNMTDLTDEIQHENRQIRSFVSRTPSRIFNAASL